jgi:hypothetical protein
MEIAMRQITFANQPSFEKHARPSHRKRFLTTMEAEVSRRGLEALIEPHDPKAGDVRQPDGLSIMLRIYFLQHWFNLSDPGATVGLAKGVVSPRPKSGFPRRKTPTRRALLPPKVQPGCGIARGNETPTFNMENVRT